MNEVDNLINNQYQNFIIILLLLYTIIFILLVPYYYSSMNKMPHISKTNQQHNNHNHRLHQYPFYKTYIDIQCRKDILTENQHMNKKIKAQITPFITKTTKKIKQNKLRLISFIGFIVLFKMQPVYDYIFEHNKGINWVYNNMINYYLDCTKPVPKTIKQLSMERKLVEKSEQNKRLAELFYTIDSKQVQGVLGYDNERQCFTMSSNNNNTQVNELSLSEFIKVCNNKKYPGSNNNNIVDEVRNQLNNLLVNHRLSVIL